MEDASCAKGAEVKGAPSLYEFTAGGALTFNYEVEPTLSSSR